MMKKSLVLFALAKGLATLPASAGTISVTDQGGALAWSTDLAVGQATLTVSGPGDYHAHHVFDGEMPSFNALGALADGTYVWELLVVAPVSDADRAKLDASRESGRAVKVAVESSRASGSFSIDAGQLIFGDADEPAAARATGESPASALAGSRVPTKMQTFVVDV
ncbi:MAG: hypothetical protein AAGE94_22990, partial [Acidobacteriota bacterium]